MLTYLLTYKMKRQTTGGASVARDVTNNNVTTVDRRASSGPVTLAYPGEKEGGGSNPD